MRIEHQVGRGEMQFDTVEILHGDYELIPDKLKICAPFSVKSDQCCGWWLELKYLREE